MSKQQPMSIPRRASVPGFARDRPAVPAAEPANEPAPRQATAPAPKPRKAKASPVAPRSAAASAPSPYAGAGSAQFNLRLLTPLHERYARLVRQLADDGFKTTSTEIVHALLHEGPDDPAAARELVRRWRRVRADD